jgi:sulfur carrier protein ThiS
MLKFIDKLFNKKKGGLMANKKSKGDIVVKVFRSGGKGQEVALNGQRSILDALKASGLSKKDAEIVQVNGDEVEDMHMELEDGDRVVLVKNVEGGAR